MRALRLVLALVVVSCAASVQPVTGPEVGAPSSTPEIACDSNADMLAGTLAAIGSDWDAVAGSASQAGQSLGCCAYAEAVNAYLSAIPPHAVTDTNAAYDTWTTYRITNCGGACMRTAGGCL